MIWSAMARMGANCSRSSRRLFDTDELIPSGCGRRVSLKRRNDAGAPPIPVGGLGNDLIAVAVGLVAYLALAFAFHPVVIGVPVIGV